MIKRYLWNIMCGAIVVGLCLFLSSCTKTETITLPNGYVYTGPVTDKLPDGPGIAKTPSGSTIEATWVAGVIQGDVKITMDNGSKVYQGKWSEADGVTDDTAKITYGQDGVYTGSVKSGLRDGEGTYTKSDGTELIGTWHQDNPDPLAEFTAKYANGNSFSGTIAPDLEPKVGWMSYADGSNANGTFDGFNLDDEYGTYTNSEGVVYNGKFADGTFKSGTCTTPIGTIYTNNTSQGGNFSGAVGHWKLNGWGTCKKTSGEFFEGEFVNDAYDYGKIIYASGGWDIGWFEGGRIIELDEYYY